MLYIDIKQVKITVTVEVSSRCKENKNWKSAGF